MTAAAGLMPFDRIVAKEVSLGAIRDIPPPSQHIGLTLLAPFKEVGSDDVIFSYLEDGLTEGLAPARAQDAESELGQKDDYAVTGGRARLIDWALKSTYDQSKVMNYNNSKRIQEMLQGANAVTLQNGQSFFSPAEEFAKKVATDDAWRMRRLFNRLEHMIMTSYETGKYPYVDGKINYLVDFKRPAAQQDVPVDVDWDQLTADPIGDIKAMNRYMYHKYGIELKKATCSKRVFEKFFQIDKFVALTGLQQIPGSTTPVDLAYLRPNWGNEAAIAIVKEATGVEFELYDSVYRTRPMGSTDFVNVRYTDSRKIVFRPDPAELAQVDQDGMGFGRTLTSPHPEGDWTSGFYEWEKFRTDPWNVDRGNGIKAFCIFPFMKYSYVMQVLTSQSTDNFI